jgi:NAD-dependent SIR2 family protein deacetylase
MLRPGIVWFGESLPGGAMEEAASAVRRAEALIIAGHFSARNSAGFLPQPV